VNCPTVAYDSLAHSHIIDHLFTLPCNHRGYQQHRNSRVCCHVVSCKHRGVFWDRKTRRWRCQLGYQSKKIFLGYFDDAGEAARAYDQKLVELRGAGGAQRQPQKHMCFSKCLPAYVPAMYAKKSFASNMTSGAENTHGEALQQTQHSQLFEPLPLHADLCYAPGERFATHRQQPFTLCMFILCLYPLTPHVTVDLGGC
jgi:hypothetical protein